MNIEQALETAKRIHFIGIGGSGMCPLAEILHEKGYYLTATNKIIRYAMVEIGEYVKAFCK